MEIPVRATERPLSGTPPPATSNENRLICNDFRKNAKNGTVWRLAAGAKRMVFGESGVFGQFRP
jgi:hypothetical protein